MCGGQIWQTLRAALTSLGSHKSAAPPMDDDYDTQLSSDGELWTEGEVTEEQPTTSHASGRSESQELPASYEQQHDTNLQ